MPRNKIQNWHEIKAKKKKKIKFINDLKHSAALNDKMGGSAANTASNISLENEEKKKKKRKIISNFYWICAFVGRQYFQETCS